MSALARHWSTFFNGMQLDEAKFRAELGKLRENITKAMASGAKPPAPLPITDAESVYKDVEQSFGFVPEFMKRFPPEALPGAWLTMRNVEMNPATAIPGKVKSLIGLAVSSQIPCRYCVIADTEFAKLEGATDREIAEAVDDGRDGAPVHHAGRGAAGRREGLPARLGAPDLGRGQKKARRRRRRSKTTRMSPKADRRSTPEDRTVLYREATFCGRSRPDGDPARVRGTAARDRRRQRPRSTTRWRGGGRCFFWSAGRGSARPASPTSLGGAPASSGFTTYWGRCWETGGAPVYWPWIQILRELARDLPRDELMAAAGRGGGGGGAAGARARAPARRTRRRSAIRRRRGFACSTR